MNSGPPRLACWPWCSGSTFVHLPSGISLSRLIRMFDAGLALWRRAGR